MIEVIFGVLIGLTFAIFCPKTFDKVRDKVLSFIHKDHQCK